MAKVLGIVVLGAVVLFWIPAEGQQIKVEQVKPEPAWCGGAWEPISVREVVKDGKTTRTPVAGTGGTNFGPSVPITREVKALDGKMTTVAIPTYPSNPATSVTLQHDPQTDGYKTGRVITEEGKDGKRVSKWAEIQPTILK